MSFVNNEPVTNDPAVRQLRHDLLNPLNVLFGMTTVLLEGPLNETQRVCVEACRNSAQLLLDIAKRLDRYFLAQASHDVAGPAQLADLCSIAAARVDKPFDRDTLLGVVSNLVSGPAPRILLVDDAPDIAVLVRTYLNGTACTLDVVADGERAVAQASSQPYDLVLMDVDLPGLDGATAAHAIRAADLARGAKPTPVVALSAVAAMADDAPTDDRVVAARDDPDTAPLVPQFLHNRREDVAKMRSELEQGSFSSIESIGHRMKGTGKSYGFAAISRFGAAIEMAAHQHNAATLTALLDELGNYLGDIQIADERPSPGSPGPAR